MKRLLTLAIILGIFSCEPRQGKSVEELPSNETNLHPVVVTDVIQAKNYTYVQATDNGKEIWMAILKGNFEIGKTYYYDRAMEMKNFKSKDLDRTFETVYFLEGLYDDPKAFTKSGVMAPSDDVHSGSDDMSQKQQEINIPLEEGVTLIGDLYANKEDLASKKVIVKGFVTKYNANIMDKNWVHVQDGSGDRSSFDLTITTLDEVNVGSIVKFEGTVVINKDFGHGYKYDLLLEDAIQLEKKADTKLN